VKVVISTFIPHDRQGSHGQLVR